MTGFEPAVSALTGQRVGPLHHTPERREVYHAGNRNVKMTPALPAPSFHRWAGAVPGKISAKAAAACVIASSPTS